MIFTEPTPFAEAAEHSAVKVLLPSSLNSAETLEHLDEEIRERARFSAQITNAEILDELGSQVDDLIAGKTDVATARNILRARAKELGYKAEAGKEGTIEDFTSIRRLNLALTTPVQMAQGYGEYMQGQDPTILDLYPAQELYRAQARKVPRNWVIRFADAAKMTRTQVNGFVALKNTEVWMAISRFGTPYWPYDFNSGMRTRAVARARAMTLKLIDRDTQVPPQSRDFNRDLAVTPEIRDERLRAAIIEGNPRVRFDANGTLHLVPNRDAAGNEADDEPTDAEMAQAIVEAYDPADPETWDIGDDEREMFDHDTLEKLALKRYLQALCNVDVEDVKTAGNAASTGRQMRCPKGTKRGGRFCRSIGECGGAALAAIPAKGLGKIHAAARRRFMADLKAVEHLPEHEYAEGLRARLRVKNPISAPLHITDVTGATPAERHAIYDHAQEVLNMLPPRVVHTHLKSFRVHVIDDPVEDFAGQYDSTARVLTLNRARGGVDQSTIYHEMGHWIHEHAPKSFGAAVQKHYTMRTVGEPLEHNATHDFDYRRDRFHDDYVGRDYGGVHALQGSEIVSTHLEHLHDGLNKGIGATHAQSLSELMQGRAYRETASVAYSIFYYGRAK